MNRHDFESIVQDNFRKREADTIMLAYRQAKYGHRNQCRDNGAERYFEHPRRTALIIMAELGLYDPILVEAALLHDLVEDSFILTIRDIEIIFGRSLARLITDLTRRKDEIKGPVHRALASGR